MLNVSLIAKVLGWGDLHHQDEYSPGINSNRKSSLQVMRKWKLRWWIGSKNSQNNFTRQWYILWFEDGKSLLRETVTTLRSRDVILCKPTSFCYVIHILVSLIISLLKKLALNFISLSHNIYRYVTLYTGVALCGSTCMCRQVYTCGRL